MNKKILGVSIALTVVLVVTAGIIKMVRCNADFDDFEMFEGDENCTDCD